MKNFILDVAVLIIFFAVMSFHFLPRNLHEIFGLMMLAAVSIHLFENRRHLFSARKKFFSRLINFSMLICFLTIFATGICMSNYIFSDIVPLEIRRNMTIHQLHVSLPYLLMIFIGVHIGLHWLELWNRILNLLRVNKNTLRYKIFCRVGAVVTIGLGIYGAILNRLTDRLLMKHIFATPATELSWIEFLILFAATTEIFSLATYFLDRKIFGNKKNCP